MFPSWLMECRGYRRSPTARCSCSSSSTARLSTQFSRRGFTCGLADRPKLPGPPQSCIQILEYVRSQAAHPQTQTIGARVISRTAPYRSREADEAKERGAPHGPAGPQAERSRHWPPSTSLGGGVPDLQNLVQLALQPSEDLLDRPQAILDRHGAPPISPSPPADLSSRPGAHPAPPELTHACCGPL